MDNSIICGIDEAGRGCIAGSLFVCGILCSLEEIEAILKTGAKIDDSKKLNRKNRDKTYNEVLNQNIPYFVVKFKAYEIDESGLSICMGEALKKIQTNLKAKKYLFDGNTNFKIQNIECIKGGDKTIKQISLASIIAKSLKDKESDELNILYPNYKINEHKGYCTKAHLELIKQHGYSPIHRKSFKIKSMS